MKQIALSIEQMKRLAELGLDTSDASMVWWNFCENGRWVITPLDDGYTQTTIEKMEHNHGKENILPAYTLPDILNKLPKRIKRKHYGAVRVGTLYSNLSHSLWYRTDDSNHKYMIQISKDNLLEAAYHMLLWCIKNGHIETNEKSKSD